MRNMTKENKELIKLSNVHRDYKMGEDIVGIGIFSGILPAMQAAKLKPVDALRYE